MAREFESEHSTIEENNAPLGWGLKLVMIGFTLLCVAYGFLYFNTDNVSRDAPSTNIQHGRTEKGVRTL